MIITIDADALPEGTVSISLPTAKKIAINSANSMQKIVPSERLDGQNAFPLIALGDESVPLCLSQNTNIYGL